MLLAENKNYVAPGRVRSIQQTIPADRIYPSGMFRLRGRTYSETYRLTDIDYASGSDEDQEDIFLKYSDILNSLDGRQGTYKLTLFNRSINHLKTDFLMLPVDVKDGYDHFRSEYNKMRRHNRAKASGLIQEKYFTVTTDKKTPEQAEQFFERFGSDFNRRLKKLKSGVAPLSDNERLQLLHDFYRCGSEAYFRYDSEAAKKRHSSFKDYICPDFFQFHNFDFDMNKKFGRVLFMRDWGQALNDNTLTRLMELRTNMMLSLDIIPLSAEEQKSLLDDSEMNAEGNIDRWSQRPGAEKRPFARIPMRMKKDRQIVEIYNDDVTSRGQKIFLCNLTICLLADTMELLDEYTDSLIETGYECGCQLQVMGFQQLEGLQTVLPFGPRYIQNLRDVTTESAAILLPFNAVSMNHETGIPYGVHADTKQEMMIDRRLLPNGNEWVIGVSGSGKSMRVKITAIMEALITNGDIIFLDPHGEFVALTEALGGQVIRLGGTSPDRINAMDMCHGYGEGNDTKKKSAFLISLFRSFLGSEFTKEMESILDRCCILAYKEYQMNGYIGAGPNLYDLFRILQQQPEDAAKKLTLLSEQFITGSFNYFSGYTNVDLFSRITCYDLSDMDENMWDAGMTVAMDSIWNRLILNKAANVPTFIKIDEVGRFLTNPYLTSSFESFYSEVRKYGGYITGIIQNVNKLTNSNAARNMLANSEIVVMLRQDTMDAAELKDIYDLSKIQVDMLREAENGCGIFKCGTSFISFDGTIEPGYIYDLANTKPRHEY